MLAFTREKLNEHLGLSSALIDRYQRQDAAFVPSVVEWLCSLEDSLGQLRLPLTALVAAERGRILSVADGYRDPVLAGERLTSRMVARAVAAQALWRVQDELRRKVAEIDERFDVLREKLTQLLAIASAKAPIPLPPTEPRQAWLQAVWNSLNLNGEVQGMYRYLGAALQPGDRLALLDEVIGNLLAAVATA